MPAEQLGLFSKPASPIPADARPLGDRVEVCGRCGTKARVYGRAWAPRAWADGYKDQGVVDLCCECTVKTVQVRRANGLSVPPGYEWVR